MITLLDAGGAFLILIPIFLIVFMVGVVFLEGWIFTRFQYGTFKKSLLTSLGANLASLIVGWVILGLFDTRPNAQNIFIFFLISLIAEGAVFYVRNKDFGYKKTIYATATANAATYLILLGFILVARTF